MTVFELLNGQIEISPRLNGSFTVSEEGKKLLYDRFLKWWGEKLATSAKASKKVLVKPTFHWWLTQHEGYAMAFSLARGQLVKHKEKYVVVTGVHVNESAWSNIRYFDEDDGRFVDSVVPASPDGWTYRDTKGSEYWDCFGTFSPTDIPQEVLDLACSKAMECPMRA